MTPLIERAKRSLSFRAKRAVTRAIYVGQWGGQQTVTPARARRYREVSERLFSDAHRRRQDLAGRLTPTRSLVVPEQTSLAHQDVRDLPVVERALARCAEVLDAAREGGNLTRFSINKKYLLRLPLDASDLDIGGPFVRLALDHDLLAPAAQYLGTLPILREVSLLYSPNDGPMSDMGNQVASYNSQYAHVDEPTDRHMRVFVHASDVSETSGPLHVVPADDSDAINDYLGRSRYLNRLSDEELADYGERALGRPPVIERALGPRGTVWYADTCRCWHYGSRPGTEPRLVISIWYAHPFSANLLPYPLQRFSESLLGFPRLTHLASQTRDPITRALLGVE